MYPQKKYIIIATAILLCIFAAIPKGFAQKASLNIEPSSAVISNVGETVTINITIHDMPSPGLFSYQLKIYFNKAYLKATSASIPTGHFLTPTSGVPPGIFIVDPGTIDNNAGTVSFAATLLAPETGKTGSGVLCQITFEGLAEGVSQITFGEPGSEVILADPEANEIPSANYDLNGGQITVVPEFSSMLVVLLLLVTLMSVIVLRKKNLIKTKTSY
ncbi:MAG: cohesin domain-containing protein [Candidatus Bathyarchaeia archaeon]